MCADLVTRSWISQLLPGNVPAHFAPSPNPDNIGMWKLSDAFESTKLVDNAGMMPEPSAPCRSSGGTAREGTVGIGTVPMARRASFAHVR